MEQAASSKATLLTVNNIEVIYDHVILVLKGVSLEVRSPTCWAPSAAM
jgi:branched-chain amino acid transport system ATP-binding protein